MDELTRRLRADAASIDAEISAQLDSRIRASLATIEPEMLRQKTAKRRPASFWLASSLTGVAAAAAVIAILNVIAPDEPAREPQTVVANSPEPVRMPALDLDVRAAMLTDPLSQELQDLQADLRKAEEVVRGDVRIDF